MPINMLQAIPRFPLFVNAGYEPCLDDTLAPTSRPDNTVFFNLPRNSNYDESKPTNDRTILPPPPHLQFVTPQQTVLQTSGMSGSPPAASPEQVTLTSIFTKLTNIEQRLSKLDRVETDISQITQKMSTVEARLLELETSRAYDSEETNDLRAKLSDVEGKLKSEKNLSEKLLNELNQMKLENKNVAEELVDIKTQSMRVNLLFFDFDEEITFDYRKSEDCCAKIKMFCKKNLGILDASSSIKIDRAHRIGKFTPGSKRPIVAKLNFYQDKLLIKQMVHE